MTENILCGPCGYAENNKNAEKWCSVCEEGLCVDCEKVHKSIKTSRDHRLISIEDFRQIQNITVSFNCKDHDKRLELYCKTHDVAVCLACVPSHHRACSDVIPLDKAAENAKHSTALTNLEDTLTGTLQNLKQIITDRESALEDFESQKQNIKKSIIDTRARILKKLEDLELKLLQELDTKHEISKSEANKLLNRMKNAKRDFSCLKEQTSQLKSFASDIQLFLGMRQINESVFKEVKSVKEGIKSAQNFQVYVKLNPSIMALIDEIDQLGDISIKKTTASLLFIEARLDQAQKRISSIRSISNVRLQLKKRCNGKNKECLPTGCTVLSNGNYLIAYYGHISELREYSEDLKHIRDIPCSSSPLDITVIDYDRIALTYGNKNVEIVNIKNNTIEKKLELKNDCYGISYKDDNFFIILANGIIITDISGKELKTFHINCDSYLGTAIDRIYFTTVKNKTVHCISMTGEEIWVHKDESFIDPRAITVDDHQNVFVVDPRSCSLIVIQHDGKSRRKLLSETDGISFPHSLYYNKEKQVLLLCDINGCALYSL